VYNRVEYNPVVLFAKGKKNPADGGVSGYLSFEGAAGAGVAVVVLVSAGLAASFFSLAGFSSFFEL